MKCRSSFLLILLFSFILFSCNNGLTEPGEGSISVDAGGLASYVVQNARAAHDGEKFDDSMMDYYKYIDYIMTLRVSTSGDYSASGENEFKINMSEIDSDESMKKASDEAFKTPITIGNIPVGSRIKVTAEVLYSVRFNESTIKDMLKEAGLPDEYIAQVLEELRKEMKDPDPEEIGTSEEFIVKSGDNYVSIKVGMGGHEEKHEGHGGYEEHEYPYSEDDGSINIILYTKTSDGASGSKMISYKMYPEGGFGTNIQYASEDFVDFVTGPNDEFYYIDSVGEINFAKDKKSLTNSISGIGRVFNDSLNANMLALDESGKILFYGATKQGEETKEFSIKSWCGGMFDSERLSSLTISSDDDVFTYPDGEDKDKIVDIVDFAVSLGAPSTETTGDTTEISYTGYLYLAAKYHESGEFMMTYDTHDIYLIKNPMNYRIEITGNTVTASIALKKEPENIVTIKLSEVSEEVFTRNWWEGYPFEITDMVVQDGYLYALLSTKNVMYGNGSWFSNHFEPDDYAGGFEYPVYSFGSLLKVDTSSFIRSGVELLGYDMTNETEIEMPQVNSEGNQTGNNIRFIAKQPDPTSSTVAFFAPRKFIAIRPRELIIADDGTFYYKDEDDFCYKNFDRLVRFDTYEKKLTTYPLDMASTIKFERNDESDINFQIYGCGGTTPAAPCKYRP